MLNVIAFLEAMGQDAGLRHAPMATIHDALSEQSVDAATSMAILQGNSRGIEALLDAPRITCCAFAPQKHEEDDEEPSKDDDEIRACSASVLAVA